MNCATHGDLAAVAFCRTCGKALCQNCTRDVRGVIYCESCLAAKLEGNAPAAGFVPPQTQASFDPAGAPAGSTPPPLNTGPNPTVAGILGAIPLGLGAVYCGQYAKGLAHLGIVVLAIVGLATKFSMRFARRERSRQASLRPIHMGWDRCLAPERSSIRPKFQWERQSSSGSACSFC